MTKILLLFLVAGIAAAQQEAPGRVNEIVLAWMQGEPVPGNTRPGGSDGATE